MAMYKALYRTYRPDSFAKIVGQTHIVTTLQNAIAQEKIGHAYLFHGPRGTGKTSIAKIFAAAVNCRGEDKKGKPCHACENCELIDNGQATDIIELDAASNNGVDEIRQIREFARYAPTNLPYKVYIIDEVHMLSTAAFNALLKTLEEPPAHVIFILATTEIHKIPQTIISRCQRFDFKKVSVPDMITGLQPVLSAEKIKMSDEALNYLAVYADGGMRDALSVLDQVRSYAKKEIELTDVYEVIGSVGDDVYEQLIAAIIAGDTQMLLQQLDKIVAAGKNVQLFVENFLNYLLHKLEGQLGAPTQDLADSFFLLEQMNQLAGKMRTSFLPQVALQATFLELAYRYQSEGSEQRGATPGPAAAPTQQPKQPLTEVQAVATAAQDVKPADDVLDLFDADNFVADEEEAEAPANKQTKAQAPVVKEKPPIKDEALARASLGRVMDEAVAKLKTMEIPIVQMDEQGEPIEELSTIFDEMAKEQKEGAAPKAQELAQTAQELAPIAEAGQQEQEAENISREKHRLLLWRAMSEVVLYPEYNQLEKIKRKWQTIKFTPGNQMLMMLLDVEPKIATKQEIVLSSFNKALTNQLQMPNNKTAAEQFISELMGQPYELIIVDEGQWMRERKQFSQDWKAKKVSNETLENLTQDVRTLEEQAKAQGYEYVALDFGDQPKQILEKEDEPIVQEARKLFGSDIVEVK